MPYQISTIFLHIYPYLSIFPFLHLPSIHYALPYYFIIRKKYFHIAWYVQGNLKEILSSAFLVYVKILLNYVDCMLTWVTTFVGYIRSWLRGYKLYVGWGRWLSYVVHVTFDGDQLFLCGSYFILIYMHTTHSQGLELFTFSWIISDDD